MKLNENLKGLIQDLLHSDYQHNDHILEDIEELHLNAKKIFEENFYSALIFLLTHLEFSEEEAVEHWNKIVERHKILCGTLGRQVNIRLAIIDYFTTDYQLLKNPIIIELFLYEVTEQKAMIDELTGLYNFRYFKQALEKEWKRSLRYNMKFCIAFIDMDNLKDINDTYGHLSGDRALQELAKVFKQNKRGEDVVCRYGGDEFVYILPQTDKTGAQSCIQRIQKISNKLSEKLPYPISMSVGIVEFPTDSKDQDTLIDLADKALYKAKIEGRNRVVVY